MRLSRWQASIRDRLALDNRRRRHFALEFDHYEEVPAHLAQKIIDKAKEETKPS